MRVTNCVVINANACYKLCSNIVTVSCVLMAVYKRLYSTKYVVYRSAACPSVYGPETTELFFKVYKSRHNL